MRNRADLESHKSRTSEGQQLTRELHSENMQLQASALKPDPTQDFVIQDWRCGMNRHEAAVESQKAETESLQRDFESTQNSLNNWEEANLTSVPGVYVNSVDIIGKQNFRTSNHSPSTSWRWPWASET